MEVLIEEIVTYSIVLLLFIGIMYVFIKRKKRASYTTVEKINTAIDDGLYEPVSLYPVVDTTRCIQSGACIKACPEHDILGIRNGKATIINASLCIGHGACFKACPTEAISLWIGTEKRGVELPEVSPNFETNISGMYIAGELGGMGLIRNAVKQGREAMENIVKAMPKQHTADYDVLIVGAGPAGISATLAAKKAGLKSLTIEQDSLGGTVYTYPRSKIIMTHPMDLPLHGKVMLRETSKDELLGLWTKVIDKHGIVIKEKTKAESIEKKGENFEIITSNGEVFTANKVLLALGRRGTPRKLNVQGEESKKVAYRLLDAETIENKDILIVGGGDSAIESALLLASKNKITLSYRSEKFNRLKARNAQLIQNAELAGLITVLYNSEVQSINEEDVELIQNKTDKIKLKNDNVYIFAGGELPTAFLKKAGINMNMKHGEVVLSHNKK